jgi:MGT family glycosyltransferase
MKNIHIAWFSLPHPSHLNAALPIVSVLVRRGYRVTFVTSERFAERIKSLGAEFVACPSFDVNEMWDQQDVEKERHPHPFCRLAVRTLAQVTSFYEKQRPDLIVYDLVAFAGRILANRWSIPAVKCSPGFAFDRESIGLQISDPEYRQELLEDSAKADRFLMSHGIVESDFLFHREGLTIYLLPKPVQPGGNVYGGSFFYAGRCAAEQSYYGDWRKTHTDGRPIVLVATSTSYVQGPKYFKMCIEALSGLKWHVLLSIGDQGDPKTLSPLPPHFEIVQHTSHVKILPHVSLFVCLGGLITLSESMYHGVPLIATTLGFKELEWHGANIARLGIGVHVKGADPSAETVREAVIRLSEDARIAEKVTEMQRKVRREPGAEETVNRIEEYLEVHSLR